MKNSCVYFILALVSIFIIYLIFNEGAGENMRDSNFSVPGYSFCFPDDFLAQGDRSSDSGRSQAVLDIGYPEGGFVEEFGLSLRNGDSIRLLLSDQGVAPQEAMDNVLKYRKSAQKVPGSNSEYIKYRVVAGATVDYYYFNNLSAFVSCIVGTNIDVVGNPMCRANFGQVLPGLFVSAIFSEKLLLEVEVISEFIRNFMGSHMTEGAL